ncbi:hypothetical protein DABAL43B_1544 [Psychrobacter sp. DAB_AL43B]|nr:hypothetical protein DABAL43B_1544 [Psychrobacter sp. DAB_AL43B]
MNSIKIVAEDNKRISALITFIAMASSMQFLGLSSVFWDICIVMIAHYILTKKHTKKHSKLIAELY